MQDRPWLDAQSVVPRQCGAQNHVTFSVLSLLANIAPYIKLVGFATVHYKRTIADNGIALNFLQYFRFLFSRYKPAYVEVSFRAWQGAFCSACPGGLYHSGRTGHRYGACLGLLPGPSGVPTAVG